MSRDAADTLATMGSLESAGVFRDLQASILETKNQRCVCSYQMFSIVYDLHLFV
jgi:hypothetical protein